MTPRQSPVSQHLAALDGSDVSSLRRRSDFVRIQQRGARKKGRHLVVLSMPGFVEDQARVGLTVSRRVGNAVVRNRVRRRLRELVRERQSSFAGRDWVIVALPRSAEACYGVLQEELRWLLGRGRKNTGVSGVRRSGEHVG